MKIFVVIVCALIACFFFYLGGRKRSDVKQIEKNEKIEELNKELEDKLAEKLKQIEVYDEAIFQSEEKYREKVKTITQGIEETLKAAETERFRIAKETQEKINEYHNQAKEEQNKIENDMDFIKNYRFSKINTAATAYREQQFNEINLAAAAEQVMLSQETANLIAEKDFVAKEVADLKLSRDALIEAYKREEELRLEKNFYQLTLSDADKRDIQILKTIENSLTNKECLYKLIWSVYYMSPTKELLTRIVGTGKQAGIYKITNQINGKVYIGQSVDLHTRLTNHIKAGIGISGTIARQLVHDALFSDGIENFTFEIVEKCEKEQLNKKEKLWIETYSSDKYGYNRTAGGAKEG